jgi:hypothetical protein
MAAEIVMTDGTRFVTLPSTTAGSLIKNFERRSFVEIEARARHWLGGTRENGTTARTSRGR